MATTTHMTWTYPSEYEDPWYVSFKSFVDSVDDKFYDISQTIKLTNLTDGYIPYHVADATGLANSSIYTDGVKVGIRIVAPTSFLSIYGGSNEPSLTHQAAALFDISRDGSTNLVFTLSGSSPYTASIQNRHWTVDGAPYPIALNPLGGNVGIGTVAPAHALAVNCRADNDVIVDLESEDTVEGTISVAGATVSYNAFAGSHYTQLKDGQIEPPVGAVVVSLGEIIPCEVTIERDEVTKEEVKKEDAFETVITEPMVEVKEQKYTLVGEEVILSEVTVSPQVEGKSERRLKEGVRLDEKTGTFSRSVTTKIPISKDVSKKEYFTYVDTTSKPGDKRAYGTWFGKMTDDSHGQSFGQNEKAIYLVTQVGLFKIRVTDTNGNIENGDYLETSSRPMEAQKQSGEARVNSTIAKAIIDVDWKTVGVDPELGYKWKLIPCTF
jgi:hypothetical protein